MKLAVPVVVALREVDSLWLVVSISVALVVVLLPTLPLEFVRDRRDVPVTLPLIVPALFRTTLLSPMAVKLPSTRSEEHTSELQSLMRNSYAVFCLKKKNNTKKQQSTRVVQ